MPIRKRAKTRLHCRANSDAPPSSILFSSLSVELGGSSFALTIVCNAPISDSLNSPVEQLATEKTLQPKIATHKLHFCMPFPTMENMGNHLLAELLSNSHASQIETVRLFVTKCKSIGCFQSTAKQGTRYVHGDGTPVAPRHYVDIFRSRIYGDTGNPRNSGKFRNSKVLEMRPGQLAP